MQRSMQHNGASHCKTVRHLWPFGRPPRGGLGSRGPRTPAVRHVPSRAGVVHDTCAPRVRAHLEEAGAVQPRVKEHAELLRTSKPAATIANAQMDRIEWCSREEGRAMLVLGISQGGSHACATRVRTKAVSLVR
jgi:hypothetical protein